MGTELLDKLNKTERYSDFIILNAPVAFHKFAEGKDFPIVQVHDATPISELLQTKDSDSIIGFCGQFSWKDGEISSLDGDTYSKDMVVLGFSEFESEGAKCLDVLVNDW